MSLKTQLKEKFGWDVTALPAWSDNTMPNVVTDLVGNSEFLDMLTLEEGVKGSKEISLLSANIKLQAKANCQQSPDGAVVFTEVELKTKPLYAGIKFCNEDLNGKITQILNVLGMKRQNGQLPAELEDIIMAYLLKILQRKAQRLVLLGDTMSMDPELLLFDGLVKIIDTNADVVELVSTETEINATNGYKIAFEMYKNVNAELWDDEIPVYLFTGRTEALNILEAWNSANPYNVVAIEEVGSHMRFTLPLSGIEVMTLPELNGKNKMYAIPLSLTFLGTDLIEDVSFEIKYDDYNDELKAEAKFRLGTQIIWGKYFLRLKLAAS